MLKKDDNLEIESLEFQITYKTFFLNPVCELQNFLMGLQFYNLGKITHDTMTIASHSPREKPGIFQNEKHWQSFAGVVDKLHGLVLTQQCWQCFALPQRVRRHILGIFSTAMMIKTRTGHEKDSPDPENVISHINIYIYRFIYRLTYIHI